MRHPIDPKVDWVFKALLGAEANLGLLVHFLNAVLAADLPAPVTTVELLNPYNEQEFLNDKLSVVDVKARDDCGRLYQIEIQLLVMPDLPARILYGWADLYSAQLQSGADYGALRPCWSIWLLGEALRTALDGYAHRLRMQDDQGRALLDHGGIWLLELGRFAAVHRNIIVHDDGTDDLRARERRGDAPQSPGWICRRAADQADGHWRAERQPLWISPRGPGGRDVRRRCGAACRLARPCRRRDQKGASGRVLSNRLI